MTKEDTKRMIILKYFSRKEFIPMSAEEMASRVEISKNTISPIISYLYRIGFIKKTKNINGDIWYYPVDNFDPVKADEKIKEFCEERYANKKGKNPIKENKSLQLRGPISIDPIEYFNSLIKNKTGIDSDPELSGYNFYYVPSSIDKANDQLSLFLELAAISNKCTILEVIKGCCHEETFNNFWDGFEKGKWKEKCNIKIPPTTINYRKEKNDILEMSSPPSSFALNKNHPEGASMPEGTAKMDMEVELSAYEVGEKIYEYINMLKNKNNIYEKEMISKNTDVDSLCKQLSEKSKEIAELKNNISLKDIDAENYKNTINENIILRERVTELTEQINNINKKRKFF